LAPSASSHTTPDANRNASNNARADAEIHATIQTIFRSEPKPTAVAVVSGFGIFVGVERGQLLIRDGMGEHRRERRYRRSDRSLSRVLVVGEGSITTAAFGWYAATGVSIVVTGGQGELLAAGAPALFDHGGLRRAQALAPFAHIGIVVTRYLLDRRLTDQTRIARNLLQREDRAAAIEDLRTALVDADDPAGAMVVEMRAAEHYWAAWTDELRLTFAASDLRRVPDHWRTFEGRRSQLGEGASNRHATSPANALLNYGMRLAEVEATVACLAIGLDPGMGVTHADGQGRPALSLDIMEAGRAVVEESVWRLSTTRTFRKSDFAELETGEIRVLAPLSSDYATSLLPELREAFGPVVEHLAELLAGGAVCEVRIPTALTSARRKKASRERVGLTRGGSVQTTLAAALWTCPDCGGAVSDPQRVRCDGCIDADPRQNAELRGRRGRAIAARRRTAAAWEASGGDGPFDRRCGRKSRRDSRL
jgi:CRISPR-associated endonuclease Cas1